MSFKELNLKIKYRSSDDDVVNDFYIPVLRKAKLYKRAVGFFSSTALIMVSRGISGLVFNDGKIRLIASPLLKKEDIEAIKEGYKKREQIIEKTILNSFYEPSTYFEEERLNMLAHLISMKILDIKLAYFKESNLGLYHEKIGLVYDTEGNKIAFTGSLNESLNAFTYNFESIDVFYSWRGKESMERINDKENDFDKMWNNKTKKIAVIDFPQAAKDKIMSYKKDNVDWELDFKENVNIIKEKKGNKYYLNSKDFPRIPDSITLYDYQQAAIKNWKDNNYVGIFNMATGTGKTYTGLAAAVKLFEETKKLAIIIVCPYQHLVDQWVEDIKFFNMKPIIGYSTSSQKDWKKRLKNSVIDYNIDILNYFVLVTTNVTYASDFVQNQISKIKNDVLLIVDEAHNFGAMNLRSKLKDDIPYRLALSATIERYRDPEGTQKLYDYFKKECINYSLEKAIDDEKLTPYYYYPIIVNLTSEELEKYNELTKKMGKYLRKNKNGQIKLNEIGKKIAIQRARLVAGAENKLIKLAKVMKKYKNSSHMLVYCGATTISDAGYIDGIPDNEEIRQINAVGRVLGNSLNMKVSQFTSQENSREREILKKEFAKGEEIQVLIAIRCLDEGVNIPNIKRAFILASSTNPKEYIQRRGRVLRLAPGKDYAEIFDFVTVPRPLNQVKSLTYSQIKNDKSLIKREITRMKDFADLSENPEDGYKLINKLKDVYEIRRV